MASRAPLYNEQAAKQECTLCGQASAVLGSEAKSSTRGKRNGGDHHGTRLCPRCGAILPKSIEARLRKLSQLARFGLGGDAQPLLGPKYWERKSEPED